MKGRPGAWQLMPLHQYLSVTSESSGLCQSHSKSVYSVTILTLPSQPQHSANLHSLTPTPKTQYGSCHSCLSYSCYAYERQSQRVHISSTVWGRGRVGMGKQGTKQRSAQPQKVGLFITEEWNTQPTRGSGVPTLCRNDTCSCLEKFIA